MAINRRRQIEQRGRRSSVCEIDPAMAETNQLCIAALLDILPDQLLKASGHTSEVLLWFQNQ